MSSGMIRDPLADHLITPRNAALILIDYQPAQFATVRSMDPELLLKNVVSTVKTAKTFGLPIVLCLLGTGLRFGEFAGLRVRRVHLDRALPVLQVVDTRYQAGQLAVASSPVPRATLASAKFHWLLWWSRRFAAGCRPKLTVTLWSLPVQAAGTGCLLAHGRPCRETTFAASTRMQPTAPKPTWRICDFADLTIFGTASRPGWRTRASPPGSSMS
jgi:hypothetical protein